ncbi:hypothetical protein [Micromonospora sp. LOL_027]|uniref:hypothetical protein n=1 Tax=Micromonospora sp. LOL_027 TaxID=3345419 RepID=UPI003A861BD1
MYDLLTRSGLRLAVLLLVSPVFATGASTVSAADQASGRGATAESGVVGTTVHDAVTGLPARACVRFVPVDRDRYTLIDLGDLQLGWRSHCAAADGALVAEGVEPGRYQLFVNPPYDEQRHGLQWVGTHGGTGQRHRAAVIRVRAGAVTSAPQIRLDPPGEIIGTVTVTTAAIGRPVAGVYVGLVPMVPHPKYTVDVAITDVVGRYTVGRLGPYDWALQFSGSQIATQWSGGVGNARLARTVPVWEGGSSIRHGPRSAPESGPAPPWR